MATPASSRNTSGSSASAPTTNPATVMANQANQIQQQAAQIQELMTAIGLLQAGASAGGGTRAKMATPEKYEGGREGLRPFLTNMELYCRFNQHTFPSDQDKILAVGTFLKGKAATWMQPMADDYLQHDKLGDCKDDTQEVFKSWDDFKRHLKNVFGEVDEETQAEQKISRIRQERSVGQYVTEFKQLQARIDWDDAPLKTAFYNGLKEQIKDELIHHDKPDDLQELIELATKIDNRMYERMLQKKQKHSATPNIGRYRKSHGPQYDRDGDVVMADRVQEKKPFKKSGRQPDGLTDKERRERFGKKACLRCGEVGHFRRDCPKNQGITSKQGAVKIGMVNWANTEVGGSWTEVTYPEPTQSSTPYPKKKAHPEQDNMSDLEPDSEPQEITQQTIRNRLDQGMCWRCGHKGHSGAQCGQTVIICGSKGQEAPSEALQTQGPRDVTVTQTMVEEQHREEWYRYTRVPCSYHYRQKAMVARQLGHLSHELIENSATDDRRVQEAQYWERIMPSRQEETKPGDEGKPTKLRETSHEEARLAHARLSWTTCYDDGCSIHRGNKEGSGWFPQKSKRSKN